MDCVATLAKTTSAIREFRAGKVTRYDSVADLMDGLKADDEPQASKAPRGRAGVSRARRRGGSGRP